LFPDGGAVAGGVIHHRPAEAIQIFSLALPLALNTLGFHGVRVDVTAGVIFGDAEPLHFCSPQWSSGWLAAVYRKCAGVFTGGQAEMAIVALVGGGRCRCRGASSGADRVYHRCAR
jgi:hypothetical protein